MSGELGRTSTSRPKGFEVIFIVSIIMTIPLTLWGGFVLMTTWNWFMPSIFTGLPHLSFAQAIGVGLVVSVLVSRRPPPDDESLGEAVGMDCFYAFITGVGFLVIGAVVHNHM